MQWLKRTDTKAGEQTVVLPTSFSNTDFLCFKSLQAWNDNATENRYIYSKPVANNAIKIYGAAGYESFIFAIGN